MDCAGLIPEQFEDTTEDSDQLLMIMESSQSMCSVHMATIPKVKYRNTIAGQETREQKFIEKSVMVNTVIKSESCIQYHVSIILYQAFCIYFFLD